METVIEKKLLNKGMWELLHWANENDINLEKYKKFYLSCYSAEEFSSVVKKMGSFKKSSDNGYLNAEKTFDDGIVFDVYVAKTITCERVVIGKETVPRKPEEIIPCVPEHERDIVKWKCPESFLNLKNKEEK